jgi:hypothetical protein
MRTKYRIFLFAILAFAVLAQGKEKPDTVAAPIQTGKKAYKVAITPRSVKFTINYSYVNRTGGSVSLNPCGRPARLELEKKVEGEWVTVFSPVGLLCPRQTVWIEPGETYQDTFEEEAFLPGNEMIPKFRIDVREIEGVYRLVHVFFGEIQPLRLGGQILGGQISNEFILTK